MSNTRSRFRPFLAFAAAAVATITLAGLGPLPSLAAGQGTIVGTVSTVLEADFSGTVHVIATHSIRQPDDSIIVVDENEVSVDNATGRFELPVPESVEPYRLQFWYEGDGNYLSGWVVDADRQFIQVPVSAGATRTIDFAVLKGATVTGRILGEGEVRSDAYVRVSAPPVPDRLTHPNTHTFTMDTSTGEFVISRLRPANYGLYLCIPGAWECLNRTANGADPSTLNLGTFDLEQLRTVSGTVFMNQGGAPPANVRLRLHSPGSSSSEYSAYVRADGTFSFSRVSPGAYELCSYHSSGGVVLTCSDPSVPGRIPIVVDDEDIAGVEVGLAKTPVIRGTVVTKINGVPTPLAGASFGYAWEALAVNWRRGGSWSGGYTNADGTFEISGRTGSYTLRFGPVGLEPTLANQFYNNAPYLGAALPVVAGGDDVIDLGIIELKPRELDISRIAGVDRFDTAVKISRTMFPDPVVSTPVVYIGNGYKFPDSLAAAPAATVEGGVLLTVPQDQLLPAVAAELGRLNPEEVVIVGDENSVSSTVFDSIEEIVGDGRVTRLGGINRYDTARMIVRRAFTNAKDVYVVTGANFPDALSAGAVAAEGGQPVVLVDGLAPDLDSATKQLITDLQPKYITIVGNTASIGESVTADLHGIVGIDYTDRVSGSDRYRTSSLLAWKLRFQDGGIITTGTNFADALAAVPLAARWGVPIYLARPTCLELEVVNSANSYMNAMVILGTTSTLSTGIEKLVEC